jgi:hypothetical protein
LKLKIYFEISFLNRFDIQSNAEGKRIQDMRSKSPRNSLLHPNKTRTMNARPIFQIKIKNILPCDAVVPLEATLRGGERGGLGGGVGGDGKGSGRLLKQGKSDDRRHRQTRTLRNRNGGHDFSSEFWRKVEQPRVKLL